MRFPSSGFGSIFTYRLIIFVLVCLLAYSYFDDRYVCLDRFETPVKPHSPRYSSSVGGLSPPPSIFIDGRGQFSDLWQELP